MQNDDFKNELNKKTLPIERSSSEDLVKKIAQGKKIAKEETAKKVKKVRTFLPIAISSLLSLLLIGLIEAVNASFQWSFIQTPDFWYRFLIFQFANIMLTLTITVVLLKMKKQKDEAYLANKEGIKKLGEHDKDDPFLDDESMLESIKRKTNAWKNKVKRKREKWRLKIGDLEIVDEKLNEKIEIEEVDNKSNLSQIETFLNNRDNFTVRKIKVGFKVYRVVLVPLEHARVLKNNKTRRKILKYNYMLSDEYIMENIDSLKVNYNKVSKSKILSDVFIHSDENGDEPLSVSKTKMLVRKYSVKILITAFVTAFTGAMVLEAQNLGLSAWVNIVTKIFILSTNAMFAIIDNDDLFQATDMYESIAKLSLGDRLKQRHLKKLELKKIEENELEKKAKLDLEKPQEVKQSIDNYDVIVL